MSKIDELISKYCPNGVEYKSLADLEDNGFIKLGRGNVISKNDLRDNPGDYPVYSSSATGNGALGYYSKYMFDDERLSWSIDGGGRFFYRPKHKYSITNVCGWLKVLNETRLSTKYLFYVLTNEWVKKVFDYTKKAHPSVIRKEYTILVPSLPVQQEIVRILDSFTELEAELEAELDARKKQYEHYSNELLNPDNMKGEVNIVKLGKIATFSQGIQVVPDLQFSTCGDNQIRFLRIIDFVSDSEPPRYIDRPADKYIKKDGELVMLRYGAAAAGKVFLKYSGAIANNMFKISITTNALTYKFLYHFLSKTSIYNALNNSNTSTMPAITFSQVKDVEVPVPSLEEQERIVSILDKFDALVNDIYDGLPAEIDARRKQYEYWRNKLLDFKEAV